MYLPSSISKRPQVRARISFHEAVRSRWRALLDKSDVVLTEKQAVLQIIKNTEPSPLRAWLAVRDCTTYTDLTVHGPMLQKMSRLGELPCGTPESSSQGAKSKTKSKNLTSEGKAPVLEGVTTGA